KYQPTPDLPYGLTPEQFNPYSLPGTPLVQAMHSPAPIEVGGRRYDIIGVDAQTGQLQLRLSSETDRFVPRRLVLPRDGQPVQEVTFEGQQYTIQHIETRKDLPNGFTLRPTRAGGNGRRDVFVPAYRMGELGLFYDGGNYRIAGITVPALHL